MSPTGGFSRSRGGEGPPWLTGIAVAIALGLWWWQGPAPQALVYDRAALAGGEGWRWVTGHLVHCDGGHALWDIGALALIGCLLEGSGRMRLALAAAIGMGAVNAGLWWWLPGLDRYCGLSGMLNALFVVALADLWQRHRHPLFPLAALALAVKLVMEIALGQSLVVATDWPSVPLAHLAGCIGGGGFVAVETSLAAIDPRGIRAPPAPFRSRARRLLDGNFWRPFEP